MKRACADCDGLPRCRPSVDASLPCAKEHGGGPAAVVTLPLLESNVVSSQDRFI